MLREGEFMACLLVCGPPGWMKHSAIRNMPITDAIYCIRVRDWWFDSLETEIPNYEEWWSLYKRWLWGQGFVSDAGNAYTSNETRPEGACAFQHPSVAEPINTIEVGGIVRRLAEADDG